jgi:hypothetical protein
MFYACLAHGLKERIDRRIILLQMFEQPGRRGATTTSEAMLEALVTPPSGGTVRAGYE